MKPEDRALLLAYVPERLVVQMEQDTKFLEYLISTDQGEAAQYYAGQMIPLAQSVADYLTNVASMPLIQVRERKDFK